VTSLAGSEPTAPVDIAVNHSFYNAYLGDTTLPNMTTSLPLSVFTNNSVWVRYWFNGDAGATFQLFSPDQRVTAVAYAMMAANVGDGVITSNKLAPNAVTTAGIQDATITSAKLASGQVVKSFDG